MAIPVSSSTPTPTPSGNTGIAGGLGSAAGAAGTALAVGGAVGSAAGVAGLDGTAVASILASNAQAIAMQQFMQDQSNKNAIANLAFQAEAEARSAIMTAANDVFKELKANNKDAADMGQR